MLKHKLFVEDSPNFNLNLEENECSKTKQSQTSWKATFKAVKAKKTCLKKICDANEADFPVFKEVSDCESDSGFTNVSGFFSSSNQKLPYSLQEDEEIIKYVLNGQCIFKVSSISLWKHLEHLKQNPKRTYQSLKNRFLRSIKPNLFTTYRHLIPDEETVEKILTKFPELKKQVNRRVSLSEIKLPERIVASKISEGNVSSTSLQEPWGNLERIQAAQKCLPNAMAQETRAPLTSRLSTKLNFHRKVEMNGNSLTVLVNLNFKQPRREAKKIYDSYWNLRSKNKLVPCPACGRCGGSEEYPASETETDAFISNSVESKKSEESSPKKKSVARKRGYTQSQKKKKKKKGISERYDRQKSCSPSLLDDINEVTELDENTAKEVEGKSKVGEAVELADSAVLVKEADSTPAETSSVSTESIYHSSVAEFRKLIDSDEEELLVKKCLRKNRKSIGFDANMSVENMQVDSYFLESSSPALDSTSGSSSATGHNEVEVSSTGPLAQNMMKMMGTSRQVRG